MQSAGLLCDGVLLHEVLTSATTALQQKEQLMHVGHEKEMQAVQEQLTHQRVLSREAAATAAKLECLNQGTKAENTRLASELTATRINLEVERDRSPAPTRDNEAELAALRGQLAESKREAAELKVQHAEKIKQLKRVCDIKSREGRLAKSKFEALAEECEPYKMAMKKTE